MEVLPNNAKNNTALLSFNGTKLTLLKQEQAERSIFNIYFQKMKRICFQCGKPLPPPPPPLLLLPLCLWGVSRQSSLAIVTNL